MVNVELYEGGYHIVSRSGIGQALVHQEKVLNGMNVRTSRRYQKREQIVHINTVLPDSVFEAFRARKRGQKVIWFAHSTEEDFKNSFFGSNLIAPLFKKWIMFCYRQGDVIITPTEYSRHLLKGYGITKPIHVLTNGVDTDYFVPDRSGRESFRKELHLEAEAKVVVSVGHLIERKGIIEFIETARQMPDITFLWYGYTAKQLVTQTVRTAMEHMPANVRFMGFAPQEELKKAYQAADAFLFLSREETEGIVVLEALSCELPVILRDIPVYEKWLIDGKNVCKVHNMNETIACLKEISGPRLKEIAKAGRQVAETRGYRKSGRQLLKIYEEEGIKAV